MAIDDPLEKIRDLVKSQGFDGVGAALQVGGMASPVFKAFSVAKGIADSFQRGANITAAILALCDEFQRMQSSFPNDVANTLDESWFKRAVKVLMIEAVSAEDEKRAESLARVAAHGSFPTRQDAHRQEDLATYIHDLARLGTDDIRMLRLLGNVYTRDFTSASRGVESGVFRGQFDKYRQALVDQKIDADDAMAVCARLTGFGLALEVPRMETQQGPNELLFRPTRRGIYLLSLLEAAETPITEQN